MWKILLGISIFIFNQNTFALVEMYVNNARYQLNTNQILEYDSKDKSIYLIDNGVKKDIGLSSDHGFYVSTIGGELIIITDSSGYYPTTPYFYRIDKSGKAIEVKYEYKEIPDSFSYHDSFSCKYSEKNNSTISFTCSNPHISKNTKYSYIYNNGKIKPLSLNDGGVKLKICNQSYDLYVEDWKSTKKSNIKWSSDNFPLAITRGLELRLKVTQEQYAQLLNSKTLLSRSTFQQKFCIK